MYQGIGVSDGYGIGKVVVISNELPVYEKKTVSDVEAEWKRFEDAMAVFEERTLKMAQMMKERVGEHNAEILEGHIVILSDPCMQDEIKEMISGGACAEQALDEICGNYIALFSSMEDELTRQRAADIGDIRLRMLKILTGTADINISEVEPGTVLVAKDFTPSMTAGIVKENVEGILTETGGRTSHSAILARALEIPAVLSVENITSIVKNGQTVILDGMEGGVIIEPEQSDISKYTEKKDVFAKKKEGLKQYIHKETVTGDGQKLLLYGNIGNPEDAKAVQEFGGEGVGLFRTEFLFMGAEKLPAEEEQFQAYKQAAETMEGKEVIIRTLDVGGDKDIPYLAMEKEDNPFLGFRAVRYCLAHKEMYKVQLRALLRAGAFGKIKIMIPLVTCVEEVREVKQLLEECRKELEAEGVACGDVETGVMMETPAASEIADLLAKEADFFSIGTNDLTGYTMAADRGNAKAAYLYSAYQPAVLRSMKRIIEAANAENIVAGMCGEAAADPLLIPMLISFGLKEYSVTASSIPGVRAIISKWTKEEADKVCEYVMGLQTKEEVEEYLKKVSRNI